MVTWAYLIGGLISKKSFKSNFTMERVLRNEIFLKFLNLSKNNTRKSVICCSNKDQILSICDCVFNILNGNLGINKIHEYKLYKKRKHLRHLLKKSSIKTKKKILQTGGFLNILIPAIISGLSSIATAFIGNEKL